MMIYFKTEFQQPRFVSFLELTFSMMIYFQFAFIGRQQSEVTCLFSFPCTNGGILIC